MFGLHVFFWQYASFTEIIIAKHFVQHGQMDSLWLFSLTDHAERQAVFKINLIIGFGCTFVQILTEPDVSL